MNKIIPKITLIVAYCTHAMLISMDLQNPDITKLITNILPNIMPSLLDTLYYYPMDHEKKNQILHQFFVYNKWRILPINVTSHKLTHKDVIPSLYDLRVKNYTIHKKGSRQRIVTSSLPEQQEIHVEWTGGRTNLNSPLNNVYVPYLQTASKKSINSKFALKIHNKNKSTHLTIGTYTGTILAHWHLHNISVLQGSFCTDDQDLILITKQNNKTHLSKYTCGYTPEQMLCILAYRNAKSNTHALKTLLTAQLIRSLLKKKCIIAQLIVHRVNNIIKNN